ncbi:hypothetical protein TRAPUB_9481 [Trametes pubescens]|uniref:Protein kinase domain-containing protein n=1 Tax=Trametes pubescens TaxID=154538 RepID=A0A1M2W2B1_TRAPU|nr:hypothetical protein TRAPUB_9481 [Trametes pubescens]
MVYIKKVLRKSKELEIATYLYSQDLRGDLQNHCVPILDVLETPQDPNYSFMVMPFLRYIDSPNFERVEDILHDCAFKNVMMDASALYPLGHHPIQYDYLASDYSRRAPVLSRAVVKPNLVTYYFTDFGISTRFTPENEERLVVGVRGLDRTLPELSPNVKYDPFKADIYLLGNVFREHFVQVTTLLSSHNMLHTQNLTMTNIEVSECADAKPRTPHRKHDGA